MVNLEYDIDPTNILEGDEIEETMFQFCKHCYETITQPVLKNIWYHGNKKDNEKYYQHSPEPADPLTQLFLMYDHAGLGTHLKKSDTYGDTNLASICYKDWYNKLKKKIIAGVSGDHYYDHNGISMCKQYLFNLQSYDVELSNPIKQGYLCNDCVKGLLKNKIIEITPSGKTKRMMSNIITWLK